MRWQIVHILLHSGTSHHLHYPPYMMVDGKYEDTITALWGIWWSIVCKENYSYVFICDYFFHCELLCYNLNLSFLLYSSTFLVALTPAILCSVVLHYNWGDKEKISCLTRISPHISLLSNMDILITSKDALEEEDFDSLNIQLADLNIRGGYNNTILVGFFRGKWN